MGLAVATQKVYLTSKNSYWDFCQGSGLEPLLAAEGRLCRSVAGLYAMKSYFSVVRHGRISLSLKDYGGTLHQEAGVYCLEGQSGVVQHYVDSEVLRSLEFLRGGRGSTR